MKKSSAKGEIPKAEGFFVVSYELRTIQDRQISIQNAKSYKGGNVAVLPS